MALNTSSHIQGMLASSNLNLRSFEFAWDPRQIHFCKRLVPGEVSSGNCDRPGPLHSSQGATRGLNRNVPASEAR